MRTIGFPELLVMLVFLMIMLAVPAVIGVVVWRAGQRKNQPFGAKTCGRCAQRIPDLGRYCPICGQPS
jgi:predicted amidophosphoribosyltransferase